ncbi:hypothetical protein DPMN_079845 [Dreissena polymorpha]|uniref:Uncharacterized protein n=1 Tax=Dreissena polymorpha TaxID=45954 RepID=A0A9D3YTX0_DREPO|nr:hypothetical protein DPMN_079845 [Dreissena polymorpha]
MDVVVFLTCTLTSRRLPCTLTSLSAGSFNENRSQYAPFLPCTLTSPGTYFSYASFSSERCTLTSRRLPDLFRTNKSYPPQETKCTLTSRAPFERTRCTLTRRRLPCTLTSRRLLCTLTSRRLLCMLTSRRLPPITRQAPFGRTRCTLTSPYFSYASFRRPLSDEQELSPGRDLCTLTSRRLSIGLN